MLEEPLPLLQLASAHGDASSMVFVNGTRWVAPVRRSEEGNGTPAAIPVCMA